MPRSSVETKPRAAHPQLQDPLGLLGPDPGEPLEHLRRRMVDVDQAAVEGPFDVGATDPQLQRAMRIGLGDLERPLAVSTPRSAAVSVGSFRNASSRPTCWRIQNVWAGAPSQLKKMKNPPIVVNVASERPLPIARQVMHAATISVQNSAAHRYRR